MERRGQAAMEFLMTYGWAILAAIIAIAVLYLLIGNPANLVGDKFTISDPLVKNAQAAAATGVTLEVRNGAGEQVTIVPASSTIEGCAGTPVVTVGTATTNDVPDGDLVKFVFGCTLIPGNRIVGDVAISYKTTGSDVTQKATGKVNLKVA